VRYGGVRAFLKFRTNQQKLVRRALEVGVERNM
jgi:hypothetical protein